MGSSGSAALAAADILYPEEIASLDRMIIAGEPVPAQSGAMLDVLDPATNLAVGQIPAGSAEDVDRAVRDAKAALKGPWRAVTPTARSQLLRRVAEEIRARAELFGRMECIDVGKPYNQALRDVLRGADYFDYFAGLADKLQGESIPLDRDRICFTLLEPVGVTAHIVPWNYPFSTVCRGLAPALACGNTAVIKPAEQTSLTTLLLGRLLIEIGLPPGAVNVVTGLGAAAGAPLAAHPDVAHVTFTGSVETGRSVMRAAAAPLAGVTLELGGKSPVVVLDDADLDKAAAGVVRGIFFNAGQICTAGSRLVVERSAHASLLEKLTAKAKTLKLDHGLRDPEMGPLVSQEQRARVTGFVERAKDSGIQVVTGGAAVQPPGLEAGAFFQPTILDRVPVDAEIAQEEVFGPVLTVHPVEDLDEAIAVANATRFGLVAGIYSQDVSKALRFARDAEAGQIFINGYLQAGDTVPFGGYKESGIGREKGAAAMGNYCQIKAVTTVL